MDWSDNGGGGGYFNETDVTTPSGKSGSKLATRQQFLCPVTIRQILEAPEEGLQIGNFTASMVTLCGVVIAVKSSPTRITFSFSDDTGTIDCLEWLDVDENVQTKEEVNVVPNMYYQVFGCLKPINKVRKIMVFKIIPIENFNEYAAFLAEVICANQYAEKINQMPPTPMIQDNSSSISNNTSYNDHGTAFTPVQQAILAEIKANKSPGGWNKKESKLNNMFFKKQIEDAVDFLVSEGHIYSTVDDNHYRTTSC
ncbi:UNVERIFIED_CONTAM: hypothetical protein PYX00_006516 [Menopon gallinae]|uniref:Replication protein A C-terminal domain-containing protein n=1 Tax=Menopon gallinae TaxID=328185 RepID=A0AAW2HWZ9_9NEOP